MTLLRFCLATAALLTGLRAQLGQPFEPFENPSTPEKVMLGKILFWDEQLSADRSVACGTCHLPEFGGADPRTSQALNPGPDGVLGTDDDVHGSPGVVGQHADGTFAPTAGFGLDRQVTGRTAPTNLGAAFHTNLFWDGRAQGQFDDPETGMPAILFGGALESQSVAPILSSTEMAGTGRTWQDVRDRLEQVKPLALARNVPLDMQAALMQDPSYPLLFQAAFGDPAIDAARVAFALGAYQRTLIPDQTPWDLYQQGQSGAMTSAEKGGWQLFQGSARCNSCHWDPLFSDDLVHNLGLRWGAEDVGAYALSQLPEEYAAFKTPTLRNAGLRPRLFHNGQSPALDDPAQLTDPGSTLNVYLNGGGVDQSNLDFFLVPLTAFGVTTADMQLVQTFVASALTDPRAQNRLPPFDHPDLRSMSVAPPRVYGTPLPGTAAPFLVDTAPTAPGNLGFRLGLAGGDGPGLALLTFGFQSIEPAAQVGQLPWHVDVADWRLFLLEGQAGELGHATWHLPIPDDPGLVNLGVYFQLFVGDAQAPGGIAASRGWEMFVR
ncbi:MAG: hypothetical protein H6835_13995 [Planctomycetes bacterium]|nr:hypothetical protein [Planctomycetota bacterium]